MPNASGGAGLLGVHGTLYMYTCCYEHLRRSSCRKSATRTTKSCRCIQAREPSFWGLLSQQSGPANRTTPSSTLNSSSRQGPGRGPPRAHPSQNRRMNNTPRQKIPKQPSTAQHSKAQQSSAASAQRAHFHKIDQSVTQVLTRACYSWHHLHGVTGLGH